MRPSVFINLPIPKPSYAYYGHIYTQIKMEHKEQILADTEAFWSEWTDKQLIRQRVAQYIEWRYYYNGIHKEPPFPWPLPPYVGLSIDYPLDETWKDHIEEFSRALGD